MSSLAAVPSPAARTLRHSPIPVLRRVQVEETSEAIVLTGRVPTYYHKQLAQEAILPFLAGRDLHNRIEVSRR